MSSLRVAFSGIWCVFLAADVSAAQDIKVSLISVPSYSTGNYGSATETVTMYNLPVTLKVKTGAFSAKASASYMFVSTTGTSTTTRTSGFGPKSGGGGGKASGSTNLASGIGDIWLDVRYRLLDGEAALPEVTPYIKTKFPTASSGLGSGYQDYEGGVALEWAWGENTYPFVDVGMRNVANAIGTRSNISILDAGVSYGLSQTTFISAYIARDQTVRISTEDPLDVIVSWSHYYEPTSGVQAYLDKGLSTGSPDFAVGVGFERKF